jgi:WG containing repeat
MRYSVTLFFLFATGQKYELPWLVKPVLTGFDTFYYGMTGGGYIVAQKNKRFGLLDLNGKILLNFEYDNIKVDWMKCVSATKGGQNFEFDPKLRSFGEGVQMVVPLEDKRYAVKNKSGYWGVLDQKLKTVIAFEYYMEENMEKFYLKKGEEIIDLGRFIMPDGSQLGATVFDFSPDWPGVILYRDPKTYKRGIMDKDGKPITPAIYNIYHTHPAGYAVVSIDGKNWGIIDKIGRNITNLEYEEVYKINNQLTTLVKKGGKTGIIDVTNGQILVDTSKYDKIFTSNKEPEYYIIEKSNLQGICDAKGKVILKPIYDKAQKMGNYFFILLNNNSAYPQRGLFSLNGEELFKPDSVNLMVFENNTLLVERPNGKLFHMNIKKDILQAFEPGTAQPFAGNWVVVEDDNGSRFYHSNSTPPNPIWLDDVSDAEDDVVHIVKKGAFYGLMHNSGKVLVPTVMDEIRYDDICYYVKFKGKWGVLENKYL